ncbi:unnamed protein product, partial [Lampetra fluviatilis]
FMALSVCSVLARDSALHALQLHYTCNSVCHLLLHCVSLLTAASFLPQEQLKVVPVVAGVFAIARLIYWVTLALPPWCPPFGAAMTLLPSLALGAFNAYGVAALGLGHRFDARGPEPTVATPPGGQPFAGLGWGLG